jgi:hypothetical protein
VRRDTPNESPASKNGNLLGKLSATRELPETKGVRLIQLQMWTGKKPWIWRNVVGLVVLVVLISFQLVLELLLIDS